MGVVESGRLDLSGLALEDRNLFIEFGEKRVAYLVDLGNVWLCVCVWGLEVWQERFDERRVAAVGDVNASGTVRVLLKIFDAVCNDWVGCDVLGKAVS